MRQFNLFRKRGIFYVRFKDEATNRWQSGISTGESDERAAMATVALWERDGIPSRDGRTVESITDTRRLIDKLRAADLSENEARSIIDILKSRGLIVSATVAGGPAAEPFVSFLARFWDYDKSPYIKEKLSHGHAITRRHCYDMTGYVRREWAPWWADILLGDVTRDQLREFSSKLAESLSGKTVNNAVDVGRTALRWAFDNRLIPSNPADRLPKYRNAGKRRDVLSTEEINFLFSVEWPSESARLASLLAMTTGLRAGEIAGLQAEDIETDRLQVRHSWSNHDGLKTPKNGETRTVPLLPEIRDKLREHAAGNPHGSGAPAWVFWSVARADRPMDAKAFTQGLSDALVLTEVDREALRSYWRVVQRRSRNVGPLPEDLPAYEEVKAIRARWSDRGIVFHSWRHYYTSRMSDHATLRAVQTATGHRSAAMAEHYADHADAETFREVSDAARLAFSRVLTFPGTISVDDHKEAAL